ncbi:LOW QUALITY PROTEIN: hypothetical protein HID58_020665 [Brassica napus]|uniref:Malectin-like domain-containing protein n=2 Tax=Brassica napus TaxID=3708 RepID=A0ABQ8CV07_BRANA|nr:LOW QUALITY PROTEIN: hypothetical protein HID58_020665 [Brassica napus]
MTINIDCGASESYLDSDKVKLWAGDKGFTTTGKSFGNSLKNPLNTLRFFPSGNKNCYSNIPVTKSRKTLVRTLFFYGNYDDRSSAPSFDVVYDGKHRDNVVFTNVSQLNNRAIFISEVIYFPASEDISVCLIRTSKSDVPFISSIEVYGLDADMYDGVGPDEGLLRRNLDLYGFKNVKRDTFGRLWFPLEPNDTGYTELKTLAPSIDITGVPNKPPANALSQDTITFTTKTLPLAGRQIYLALYFSEPKSLGRTMKRSFNVFLDDKQLNSAPIVPVFGKVTELVVRDIVATWQSKVIFRSTSDSMLPPIVNAMELYSISKGVGGDYGGGGQSGDDPDDDRNKGREKKKPKPNEDARLKFEAAKQAATATQQGKPKPKLRVILSASLASAFAAISSVFLAIFCKRSQNAKSQSNTEPATSTGSAAEAGVEPLVGQQLASDSKPPRK